MNKSEELRVHTSYVQRDYIFGWLLSGIYSRSELSKSLVLKGGNCFRKAYFKKARYSPDLDFAITHSLADDFIRTQLNRVCDFISEHTSVQFDTARTRVDTKPSAVPDKTIQKARVYFEDFFGKESQLVLAVRLDVSNYGRILLPVQERELIHDYSDARQAASQIRCMKLEELLASKLKCLLQRQHSADLYDFVNATVIHPIVDIDRGQMVQTFLRMTIFNSGPRIVQDLLINLPFQIIKGLWQSYLVFPKDSHIAFDAAVAGFTDIAGELFGELPIGSARYAFFPSELRNPIMQAGRNMTLLRMRYHGVERMIEPYSLKYKRRQDGLAREYLYAYDQTGGRSSGPGLKSFVFQGVDSVENMDVQFKPRYEVELSKAGQLFGDTYFRGSPGSRVAPYRASRYVVQCPLCGKRFYRKRYSTKLNPHKDRHGNRCYGRFGVLV